MKRTQQKDQIQTNDDVIVKPDGISLNQEGLTICKRSMQAEGHTRVFNLQRNIGFMNVPMWLNITGRGL